jgi:hypothetical protein
METILRFTRDNTTYYSIKQPDVYFYDIGLNPINYFTLGNCIEGTRFLFAMWECFISKETDLNNLNKELYDYFNQFNQGHFAYWSLLDYEVVSDEDSYLRDYKVDPITKDMILFCNKCELIIPYPYNYIRNEDDDYINENDLTEYQKLSYVQDDQFPILFMSEVQMSKNSDIIEKYYQEIVNILKKHNVEVKNVDELFEFYIKTCRGINVK